MDGTLAYWYNGQPVILIADNTALVYWYNGQPYTFSYPGSAPASANSFFLAMFINWANL
jgi:hypothetical protein